jgi:hypothetical protein
MKPVTLNVTDARYPARLVTGLSPQLSAFGNLNLLALPKTALFCSARCPGQANPAARDTAPVNQLTQKQSGLRKRRPLFIFKPQKRMLRLLLHCPIKPLYEFSFTKLLGIQRCGKTVENLVPQHQLQPQSNWLE